MAATLAIPLGCADPVPRPPAARSVPTTTFSCTGTGQSFTVPDAVTSIAVDAWGAQGGNVTQRQLNGGPGGTGGLGGLGGEAEGTLAVTPGQTLTVNVGCAGPTALPVVPVASVAGATGVP